MCILFFAINQHPKYPVIICANRDEFHQRPTKAIHWWPNNEAQPKVLAGKDLQAGGSWLAINQHGRFSALTNYRQPEIFDGNKKSRGELVLQAVANQDNEMTALLGKVAQDYNGFNLVYGQISNLRCFDSVTMKHHALTTGFHSLCNGALDDIWPKMALGLDELTAYIKSNKDQAINIEQLFNLMQNNQQAATETLPNTGLPLDWEQLLSSIFIISPEYGTRTTNIIVQDNKGNISIYDRSYNKHGKFTQEQYFTLSS